MSHETDLSLMRLESEICNLQMVTQYTHVGKTYMKLLPIWKVISVDCRNGLRIVTGIFE